MSPLPRTAPFLALAFALAAPCCKPIVKALPDLPPPEYEPARPLDLTPKPPTTTGETPKAPASPASSAPTAIPPAAPPPAGPHAPSAPAPAPATPPKT